MVELKLYPILSVDRDMHYDQIYPYVAMSLKRQEIESGQIGLVHWVQCASIADAVAGLHSSLPTDRCEYSQYMSPLAPGERP